MLSLENSKRVGDWIQTYKGIQFYPLDPRPEDIDIYDIAHALSNQCRWTGHTRVFYSVAEHSVKVAQLLWQMNYPEEICLWGLLHDASEAYISDVSRPVKRMDMMQEYRKAERTLMDVIMAKHKLPLAEPPEVRIADNILMKVEAERLMLPPPDGWTTVGKDVDFGTPHPQVYISGWAPELAKQEFLSWFRDLT